MRVLITGAGGQLGRELAHAAPPHIEVCSVSRAECDVSDPAAVAVVFADLRPEAVINAAAFTAVDKAEVETEAAFRTNALGAQNLAVACAKAGARIIQISTDYVFDGSATIPYRTSAPTSPLNVYGRSKLAGEEAVRKSGAAHVIVRCGWLYSKYPGNFLTRVLDTLTREESVRVVSDQFGVPTACADLAAVIWWLTANDTGETLRHWTPAGSASRYDFACAIRDCALKLGVLSQSVRIDGVGSAQYPVSAPRPRYTVLDASETWRAMGAQPPHWTVSLERTLRDLL